MGKSRKVLLVAVALIGVLMSGCRDSSGDGSADSVAVVVAFTEGATDSEMGAFFQGFNAGSFVGHVETKALSLTSAKRRMDVTFENENHADSFIVMAERADVVESAERR